MEYKKVLKMSRQRKTLLDAWDTIAPPEYAIGMAIVLGHYYNLKIDVVIRTTGNHNWAGHIGGKKWVVELQLFRKTGKIVVGTLLHEIAHCVAGNNHGHDKVFTRTLDMILMQTRGLWERERE